MSATRRTTTTTRKILRALTAPIRLVGRALLRILEALVEVVTD